MQNLVRSKTIGVTGSGGRGTVGAGPGRDLPYHRLLVRLLLNLAVDVSSVEVASLISARAWNAEKFERTMDQ